MTIISPDASASGSRLSLLQAAREGEAPDNSLRRLGISKSRNMLHGNFEGSNSTETVEGSKVQKIAGDILT
jgi:hypothetical protein